MVKVAVVASQHLPADSWTLEVPNLEVVEEAIHAEVHPADLVAFVDLAVRRNVEAFNAFEADRREGTDYRSPSWMFAATLRGHPEFSSLSAAQVVGWLDRLGDGEVWRRLPEADCFDEPVDPRNDFFNAWKAVRKPIVCTPTLGDAARLEERWPLTAAHWPSDHDALYRKLVGIVYWYAKLLGADGDFYLSCRLAGKILDVSHESAWRLLKRAESEGLLYVVTRGDKGFGKATRYRFQLERVEVVEQVEKAKARTA